MSSWFPESVVSARHESATNRIIFSALSSRTATDLARTSCLKQGAQHLNHIRDVTHMFTPNCKLQLKSGPRSTAVLFRILVSTTVCALSFRMLAVKNLSKEDRQQDDAARVAVSGRPMRGPLIDDGPSAYDN